MKNKRSIYLLSIMALMLALLSAALAETLNSFRSTDDIAVVVNEKNSVTAVTMSDLRKILLGERKFWKGNSPVQLVLRDPGTPEREKVIGLSLKMDDAEFAKYWRTMVFRGEASAEPLAVPSNGMATEYVADTPGAITFVIGRNLRPDLKVLKVDGKYPGEAGYPLR
jgi:ABC-type phosphate transport system substrate-binding protein